MRRGQGGNGAVSKQDQMAELLKKRAELEWLLRAKAEMEQKAKMAAVTPRSSCKDFSGTGKYPVPVSPPGLPAAVSGTRETGTGTRGLSVRQPKPSSETPSGSLPEIPAGTYNAAKGATPPSSSGKGESSATQPGDGTKRSASVGAKKQLSPVTAESRSADKDTDDYQHPCCTPSRQSNPCPGSDQPPAATGESEQLCSAMKASSAESAPKPGSQAQTSEPPSWPPCNAKLPAEEESLKRAGESTDSARTPAKHAKLSHGEPEPAAGGRKGRLIAENSAYKQLPSGSALLVNLSSPGAAVQSAEEAATAARPTSAQPSERAQHERSQLRACKGGKQASQEAAKQQLDAMAQKHIKIFGCEAEMKVWH